MRATQSVGDATRVASRIISKGACQLMQIMGNNGNGATRYIQVHEAAALPAEAAVPKFTFKVAAGADFLIDFGTLGVGLAACVICTSSTQDTKTIAAAELGIQATIGNPQT